MAQKKYFRNSQERGDDGYRLYPVNASPRTWFYEHRKGLTVVHEFRDDKSGILISCDQIEIPWFCVEDAVKSHRAAMRRKPRTTKR